MDTIIKIITKSPPYIYTLVITLAICWLTLVPPPLPDNDFELFAGADKIAHAIMFAALAAALYIDMQRRPNPLSKQICLICAFVFSALAGGVIELVQTAMDMGRSGDWLDFAADCIGAAAGSVLAWRFFAPGNGRFSCAVAPSSVNLNRIERIYKGAFPPEEQRPWNDIVRMVDTAGSPFTLTVISLDDAPVGLLTSWSFDEFTYIEHFAIDPAMRGRNIGSRALRLFCRRSSKPVVLEVEPASLGHTAQRRISFYERMGFHSFPGFRYIQPPYAPGLPPVELMLMSNSRNVDLQLITNTLHSEVYGKK